MILPDDLLPEISPTEPKGNPVLRMIVVHWALGAVLGVFCAAMLLALDPMGLRTLLMRSDAMIPGLVMLFVGFASTFGGVVAATAVMFEKKDDDDDEPPSGGWREKLFGSPEPELIPIRIYERPTHRGHYRRDHL